MGVGRRSEGERGTEMTLVSIEGAQEIREVTMADCHGCPAIRRSIFSLVAGEDRAELITHFRLMSFPPKAAVFHEGDRDPYLHIIRAGIAKLIKAGESGDERIVRLVRPGDAVGLERLLGDACRHTVSALTRLETCRMSVDEVTRRIDRNPELGAKLFRQWQDSLDNADLFLTEFSTGTAHARVARLLLYMTSGGVGENCVVPSREDMAAMLGLTTETVSRITAEFKRQGLMVAEGDHCCEVLDLERLREIASASGRGTARPDSANPAP